jgi:REP element-mobilizing transposase RayT
MMARWLVDDLRHYGSSLAAFVVMPEHLHWVCTVPAGRDVSWLVNRVKSNSGKALNNGLTPQERAALSQQAGLNGRSVWQRSFRSVPLDSDSLVAQKCEYIHLNPVRRGLSACPFSYYASSARFHAFGTWPDDFALPSDVGAILDCRRPWP